MNDNWTVEDLARYLKFHPEEARKMAGDKEIIQGQVAERPEFDAPKLKGGKKRGYNKYRVAPKEDRTYNGVVYHSKRESEFAQQLDLRKSAGEITFWIRQVPFLLPGETEYRLDFMTFAGAYESTNHENIVRILPFWDITFYEVKGRKIRLGEIKRKQTEEIFGIHIQVV